MSKQVFSFKCMSIALCLVVCGLICAALLKEDGLPETRNPCGEEPDAVAGIIGSQLQQGKPNKLRVQTHQGKIDVGKWTASRNWRSKGKAGGRSFELVDVSDGQPVYLITCNADAAISTGADLLQGPPLALDGNSVTVGIWDTGWVRFNHQEFAVDRVSIMDSPGPLDGNDANLFSDHATHVAGTIGAIGLDRLGGIDPAARGMAPAVQIESYDWDLDTAEMEARGATSADESGKLYISNHSYGVIAGWEKGAFRTIIGDFNEDDIVNFLDWAILANAWLSTPSSGNWDPICDIAPWPGGDNVIDNLDLALFSQHWLEINVEAPYWFGVWGQYEDRKFGWYDSRAASWDDVCYKSPYYLPFKAAGNDRQDPNNNAPPDGTAFWYMDPNDPNDPNSDPNGGMWVQAVYNDPCDPNAAYPYDDSWDNGGYDTIPTLGVAKNIMTVGAVEDAVAAGLRDANNAAMTTFSVWGPTDDGRIKPDIVANGYEVYSCVAANDVNSYGMLSGTTQASANAAGSAALLVDYYNGLGLPDKVMRASTLKALIIHTADDLLTEGPDYRTGWGLMDANEAADYITTDYKYINGLNGPNDPNGIRIIEGVLAPNTENVYKFVFDSNNPYIRATLCWTDPPGAPVVPLATDPNDTNDVNDGVLDNNSPCLVNDLDLRVFDTNDPNIIYLPYVLDPNDPNKPADFNDNILDNVEQVYFTDPNKAINYAVQISSKGSLTNGLQHYSLILSEPIPIRYIWVDDDGAGDLVPYVPDPCKGGPNSDPLEDGSPAHPFDSIQKAIDDANEPVLTIIRVLDGTYMGVGNYDIDTMGRELTVKSEYGPGDCKIDCQSLGRAFVIHSGETATTVIEGFTMRNGYAYDPNWPKDPCDVTNLNGYGGAICCTGSSPWIKDCVIKRNEADYGGGAIFCGEDSSPLITGCNISYFNKCGSSHFEINQMGGAIYCKDSSPAIFGCTINWNEAQGAGGGIASENSYPWIVDCDIIFNDCFASHDEILQHGGGIFCYGGSAVISRCAIEYNYAKWSGGGIAVLTGDHVEDNNDVNEVNLDEILDANDIVKISACLIAENVCGASGAGVYSEGIEAVTVIDNCLIAYNNADWSGAVSSSYGGWTIIESCTIANNFARYNNPALAIGGLECWYGSASVRNSIIWDNSGLQIDGYKERVIDPNDPNDTNEVGFAAVTYSDVYMVDSNDYYKWDPNAVWPGEGNINEDPLFDSIIWDDEDNGWWDYHLKSPYGRFNPATGVFEFTDTVMSPCIDAGDPASHYSNELSPNGGRINMGVYGDTPQASLSGRLSCVPCGGAALGLDSFGFSLKTGRPRAAPVEHRGADFNKDAIADECDWAFLGECWLDE